MNRLAPLLAALALLAPRAAPAAGARSVQVAVAANLKPAFEAVARAFEAAHPGVEVKATFGASGSLYAQLANGAPFDLFLSADAELPARLAAAGLADGAPFTYALGTLVVWLPASAPAGVERRGLAALADPAFRKIAIANPEIAPYGRAAEAALRAAGVWDAVKDRLVFGQNASQAAQFAQSGNAQAALLPLSLAIAPPLSTEGRRFDVPGGSYEAIRQDGVVLAAARQKALARDLAAYLRGPARAILERGGYALPPE